MNKFSFHLISHTHWDREWYLSYETFRSELIDLIDNLLNILNHNPNFIFHLDGHTLLIDDYLEIKPHKIHELKKYIKSGNILCGPWYTLCDEFLVSGESIIRNLLLGINRANELGSVMNVGYLPDQFGHIAQLPQILAGFRIKSCILARGIQDGIAEHIWEGLNKEKIFSIVLTHWYNNAQTLPHEKESLTKYLENIFNKQNKTSLSNNLLLMNGCDHLFPQENIVEIISNFPTSEKWQIAQTTLPKAIDAINKNVDLNKIPIRQGELRDDNNMFVLSSTLSSRVYLKLKNHFLQNKIEKTIEPLSSLLMINSGEEYRYYEIYHLWKFLLMNHAHDSICGCSIDEVHREMEIGFKMAEDSLENLQKKLFLKLNTLEESKKKYVQLINLLPIKRKEYAEIELEFPLGPLAKDPGEEGEKNLDEITHLTLIDTENKTHNLDFEVVESIVFQKMQCSRYEVPLLQCVQKVKLLVLVELEALSIKTFEVITKSGKSLYLSNPKDLDKTSFENDFYKLNINLDGTFNIFLLKDKKEFKNLHSFSLEDDCGDLYRFMQDENSESVFFNVEKNQITLNNLKNISYKNIKWEMSVIEENILRKIFLLKSKDFPGANIEIKILCYKESQRIDFKTKIKNKNKNKRLRIHFPTQQNTDYIFADTPFGIIERKLPDKNWKDYAFVQPLHNFLNHKNKNMNFIFFGNGISEYELYEDGNGFGITLIRSIGKLSVVKSHSFIDTPEGQCIRDIDFSYSIIASNDANPFTESLYNLSNILINQSNKTINLKNLITFPDEIIFSTLKRSENNEKMLVLRGFNSSNNDFENLKLSLNFSFKSIYILNLNEEVISEIKLNNLSSNKELTFNAKPFEIITFGIET